MWWCSRRGPGSGTGPHAAGVGPGPPRRRRGRVDRRQPPRHVGPAWRASVCAPRSARPTRSSTVPRSGAVAATARPTSWRVREARSVPSTRPSTTRSPRRPRASTRPTPTRRRTRPALDQQSLASFIDAQHLRPEARFLVETDYRSEYNSDPAHVSMLFIAPADERVGRRARQRRRDHADPRRQRPVAAGHGHVARQPGGAGRAGHAGRAACRRRDRARGLAHRGGCVGGRGVPDATAAAGHVQPPAARVGGRARWAASTWGRRPRWSTSTASGSGRRSTSAASPSRTCPTGWGGRRPTPTRARRACSTPSSPGPQP